MPFRSRVDIAVAVFLVVVGVIGLYGSMLIEPTALEPVGAAPIPRWVSISIIVMALAMLVLALRPAQAERARQRSYQQRPALVIAAVGLVALYITSMQAGILGFRAATVIFIIAFGLLMSGLRWRALAVHAVIAIAVALGSHALFTDLLFVDLPQ